MPDGEKITIVAHPQSVPNWLLDSDKLKANFMVRGDVTDKQLKAVAEVENLCVLYAGTVRPSNFVIVAAHGVLYALAGAAGVGLGAHLAFEGAKYGEYARYGGTAGAFAGAANGVVTTGGHTYTFENCSREALNLVPQYGVRVLNNGY